MAFPEAQPLLDGAQQQDLESPGAPSPRPAAYSDAIARLEQMRKSPEQEIKRLLEKTPTISRKQQRSLHSYYLRQNELIDALLQTEQIHRGLFTNDAHQEEAQVRRALAVSFAANCLLLVVRTALALLSGSLSLVIATLDAVLDVLSSIMLYWSAHQAKQRNKYQYPVGKERMEPLGIIVFSVIMGTAAFQVIVEGVKALLSGAAPDLGGKMGIVVGGTLGVVAMKLALFLYCRGSPSPAVAAFALDHLNDVLVNGVGLAGALLGAKVAAWWDPAIAIALSLFVVWAWGGQAQEHLLNLVGRSAPPDLLQRLTYLAFYHDERVQKIDTVRAFTFGSTYIAEVDIVLPPHMTVQESHDIGESLQVKLELLPEVSRAYVHIDHEYTHAPEHS